MLTTLGQFIEEQRKKRGHTQLSISAFLKIKQGNYSAMIHGKRPFSEVHLDSLADFLGFNKGELTFIKEERNDRKVLDEIVESLNSDSIRRLKEYAKLLKIGEKS
jgi:transcriptional regulator with XRE-family HTH domain